MASRRKLKKTIRFVTSELITDIYFRCLGSKSIDTGKIEDLVQEVAVLSDDFVLRASRPDGKENPKIVRSYYQKLFADWQNEMEKITGKIESI